MKSYEGMFLLKPDLTKDNLDKTVKQLQEVIEKQKGSSDEVKEWGKQRLSYPIKKYNEAVYYLVKFNIDPESISKIKRSFSLNESILRAMITKR